MSCGQDRSLCLWNPLRDDMKDGFLIKRYKGPHNNAVNDLSISTDNQTFVSCGEERDVFLWDITSSRVLRRFYGHSQRVNTLSYNKDSSVFASGSYDTTVKLWDTRNGVPQFAMRANT
ncbi:mitogen-activated protein kinase [Blastocystis sp. subtype 4]|uniref:mitogen-activated protein kinase n=1 Tax=Blastocystis sp. subtype 4 TaxID=944170 RepID=UPI0007121375|nr:mitogen-activated protein kinase [Blastocystis sp. subtype 4]KNB42688.1 mitogen-activated protein kinase [Blastocystis sp. subtype 4]|eukprot:XP_014526131.1 mitogen-activated protein kinase [Blastocystis sp. subtype 4]